MRGRRLSKLRRWPALIVKIQLTLYPWTHFMPPPPPRRLQVFNARTLAVEAEEVASIAFVSGVVFNADNNTLIAVGGDANCHVTDLRPCQGSG